MAASTFWQLFLQRILLYKFQHKKYHVFNICYIWKGMCVLLIIRTPLLCDKNILCVSFRLSLLLSLMKDTHTLVISFPNSQSHIFNANVHSDTSSFCSHYLLSQAKNTLLLLALTFLQQDGSWWRFMLENERKYWWTGKMGTKMICPTQSFCLLGSDSIIDVELSQGLIQLMK